MKNSSVVFGRFALVLLAGCICLALAAPSPAAELRLGKDSLTYDALRVRVVKGEAGLNPLAFYYKDKRVALAENNVTPLHKAALALKDFPNKGDDSLCVSVSTGGAHCCHEQFIFTRSGGKATLYRIDRRHSDLDSATDPQPVARPGETAVPALALEIDDWSFAYYQTPDAKKDLAFAYSPAFSRLLLWENGRWRPDRPGEFSQRYRRILAGLEAAPSTGEGVRLTQDANGSRIETQPLGPELEQRIADEELVSKAMQLAYYRLMLNEAPERVLERLKAELPESWRAVAEAVLKDARAAVQEFNPVERFSLE
jgi:hypothetical protein